MTDPSPTPVSLIADGMARFREEMDANNRYSLEISIKTKRILAWSVLFLGVITIVLLFQIVTMRSDLMIMVEIMEDMYSRFQLMARNVDGMTGQVVSIQKRVADFPSVAADMTAINGDVGHMRGAIGDMTGHVGAMAADMAALRDTTAEMYHHFYDVQGAVGTMNYNVDQMMRPMSLLPR
jgi:hypothetical protein